ncbi:MAG TPA: hypothetical protein PLX89_06795 [Verrucomicrobiota bacterium]|nr:hypothetical protein [Verrucomicrobiales bacterium]HRI12698.1 hypothetical protein [Verrucomicrobiota bacterium]
MKPQTLELATDRSPIIREPAAPVSSGFKVGDLAYILFRHKWKILACFLLGLAVAAGIWYNYQVVYVSEGKILIRYILENRSVDAGGTGDQLKTGEGKDTSMLASELELLNSFDLAEEVARDIGATNILKGLPEGGSDQAAAGYIRSGLSIRVRAKSNVISVSFAHPDPVIARKVVTAVIARYQKMHARIHRALDVLEDLARQADQKRSSVEQTEADLLHLKSELGIVSVADAQKALSDLTSQLRTSLLSAETELMESRESLARLTNSLHVAVAPSPKPAAAARAVDTAKVDSTQLFQSVIARIDSLRRREQELLLQFTPTSKYVTRVSAQIVEAQAERDRMIAENPALALLPTVPSGTGEGGATPARTPAELVALMAGRVAALETKVKILNEQLKKIREEALKISDKGVEISQLERKLQVGEKQYTYYATSFEEATANSVLSSSRLANIAVFQAATPPRRDTALLPKLIGGATLGGLALGLAIAALIEFFTDESVRRPRHVSENLNLPLYLTMPRLPHLPEVGISNGIENGTAKAGDSGSNDEAEIARYSEALRDRLIMHFQIRDLTHKPKLIGVTSCGHGAGVTTLATSLAATLSETGEGNVLYVDVNQNGGPAVHPFRKGKPVVGIGDALAAETRDTAMVSENLYMVSLGDPNSRRVGVLPKRLASLVPQMKASDYDYIIFDLPPVSQTSATARVAGLLDITVMVLESEKTHRDLARQAVGLLAESNSQMVAVLNKHRRYLPQRLDGDL